jgi:lysophospholipase L1-like esterase
MTQRAFKLHRQRVVAGSALLGLAFAALAESPVQFDFGPNGNVSKDATYDATRGFGFEPPAPGVLGRSFSVRLPEGNYLVTLRFGDERRASRTTVGAESRRLMLQDIVTTPGQFVERSFVVNVRAPSLPAPPQNAPGSASVRLKPQELAGFSWDDKLTLQFVGEQAHVATVKVTPVEVPVVYLAGDSTVTDQSLAPAGSWGQMLPRFFDKTIAVANHAESGETLKSFLAGLRLDKILSTLRAGDWVVMQFGHNDQKAQWPQTYVAADSTYRAYLRTYIAEVRRRGATPILATSPERRNFDANGRIVPSHGAYPEAVRAVAREESVALIDLHAMSIEFYEALGPTRLASAFGKDDLTHHTSYGAYELARRVASSIRTADAKLMGNLAQHLANDVAVTDRAPH